MSRAEYMRKWRERNREEAHPLSHGTDVTSNNYGCRCDDCRDAHAREERARRKAQQRVADAHRDEYLRYLADERRRVQSDDPPPAPVVADPKLITHLIGSGTVVPPPYPAPEHIDGSSSSIGADEPEKSRGDSDA